MVAESGPGRTDVAAVGADRSAGRGGGGCGWDLRGHPGSAAAAEGRVDIDLGLAVGADRDAAEYVDLVLVRAGTLHGVQYGLDIGLLGFLRVLAVGSEIGLADPLEGVIDVVFLLGNGLGQSIDLRPVDSNVVTHRLAPLCFIPLLIL